MKALFIFLGLIYSFVAYPQNVQSFVSSPALNVPTSSTRTSTLNVSGAYNSALNASWGFYRVRVNITHNSKAFITLRLTSPAGTTCTLVTAPGLPPIGYRQFSDTWFRDDAAKTFATFYGETTTYRHHTSGSWIPQTSFSNFNNGQNPNGTWTLTIVNNNTTNAGTLNSWEIEFRNTPNGDRSTSVWVTNSESGYPTYNDCSTPKKMDKYYNYYGRTRLTYSGNSTTDPNISSTTGMPWRVGTSFNTNSTLDNTIWYSFKTNSIGGAVNILFSFINRSAGTGYQVTVLDPGASPCVSANWTRVAGTSYMGDNAAGSNPYDIINAATVGNIAMYNSMIQCTGLAGNKEYYVCIDGNGAGPASDIEFQIEATGNVLENFTVLPVELVSFEASQNLYNNILSWQTASEVNNSHFEIEKSNDAISFEKIGIVKSKYAGGNSSRYTSYNFNDELSSAYYRLKQVNIDGSFSYSKTAFVETTKTPSRLKIYPNPSEGLYTIENIFEENEIINIQVYDVFGKLISKETVSSNQSTMELNLEDLEAGWYFVSLEQAGKRFQEKVLITK